jgi:hypothetical protein
MPKKTAAPLPATKKPRIKRMFLIEGSGMLHKVGYDVETASLVVQFVNYDVWLYESVGVGRYVELLNAESPGKYFNAHIKPTHTGKKLHSEKDTHIVKADPKPPERDVDSGLPLIDTLEASVKRG